VMYSSICCVLSLCRFAPFVAFSSINAV
jgi:hypothetical protein